VTNDSESTPVPVEDGWEPELPRRGPIDWFRDYPAAFFGTLGTILFVGGWGVAIYLALSDNQLISQPTSFRLQLLVSVGSSVTLASGVLWAIAVYIWLHLLPDVPTEVAAQGAADTSTAE
jgi:hypothetical protein